MFLNSEEQTAHLIIVSWERGQLKVFRPSFRNTNTQMIEFDVLLKMHTKICTHWWHALNASILNPSLLDLFSTAAYAHGGRCIIHILFSS